MKFSAKCFLFLLFFYLFFGCFAFCDEASLQDVAADQSLVEEGRVHVKGTNVSMVPPEGFVAAKDHNGFIMPGENISIIIIEIPQSYAECKVKLTEEHLVARGDVLDESQELVINGQEAISFDITINSGNVIYHKYLFAYGNDMLTSMVYAVYPDKSDNAFVDTLKKSVLTARYHELSKEEAEQSLPFSIKQCDGFKIGVAISNIMVCSIEGELFQETEKPVLTVVKSLPQDFISYKYRKDFALNSLRNLEYIQDVIILSNSMISINGLHGYKIMAKGNHLDHDSQPLSVYFVILFDENCYYMMIGEVSPSLRSKYFPSFKRMIQSFKVKEKVDTKATRRRSIR